MLEQLKNLHSGKHSSLCEVEKKNRSVTKSKSGPFVNMQKEDTIVKIKKQKLSHSMPSFTRSWPNF